MKVKGVVKDEKGRYFEIRTQLRPIGKPPEIPEKPKEPEIGSRPFKMTGRDK